MKTLWLLIVLVFVAVVDGQEELSNPDCNHWLDPGECNNFTVKWYYDRYDHRCRQFYYSGCGGNANTYNSQEECSASCTYVPPTAADRCSLPHEPGHCNSDIERWFFDWEKKQCVCSYWTGCGGNSNLFYSYNHCMEICGEFSHPWIGPGIDEKYWGVLNQSSMSPENQAVFVNKPAFVYPPDAWWNPANAGQAELRQPSHPAPVPAPTLDALSPFSVQPVPVNYDDNDYSDYREMVATETKVDLPVTSTAAAEAKNDIPIVARGAKTVIMERYVPEMSHKRWVKKIRKNKVPPRRIQQAEEMTTPAPSSPPSTFSYTYHTDSRGNTATPQRDFPPVSNAVRASQYPNYQPFYNTRYSQYRTQYSQNSPVLPTPIPTQFYVTYKTDQYGRQVWNQKIWWTGEGPMPIQALRSRYPYWLPPPYDGFGRNPYEDYEKAQDTRRWNQTPAVPVVTSPPASWPTVPPTTTTTSTTTTTTTPVPTTTPTLPPTTQPVLTTQIYYTTPPPPVYTTQWPGYYSGQQSVQTTLPAWVRRYQTTPAPPPPPPPAPTRPWWTYTTTTTTTTPAPTRPLPPPAPTRPAPEHQNLRQYVRQPPTYIPAIDMSNHYQRPLIQDMTTRSPYAQQQQYHQQRQQHYQPQQPYPPQQQPQPPPQTTARSFTPVRKTAAEPVEYQRWLVQSITTEKPELSIDDIIALDEETYDDYEMQMEPDPQDEPLPPTRAPVRQPQRSPTPPPTNHRRPPAQPPARNDGWAPIVMPPPSHRERVSSDYANSVDFEIQSHSDA